MEICPTHGEFREKINNIETKLEDVCDKQHDLRKPEDGALSKIHEKINTRATKDDLTLATNSIKEDFKRSTSSIKWFIGILMTVLAIMVTISLSGLSDVKREHSILKERVDQQMITKDDLKVLKVEIKEAIRDMHRKSDR